MSTKVAINGFGRIGRNILRAFLANEQYNQQYQLQIVAINDITDFNTLVHLLKYDSVQGILKEDILLEGNMMIIGKHHIQLFSERSINANTLIWKKLEVDIVIESTGLFLTQEQASTHIQNGAKKVLLSAPAKGLVDATIVLGVNEHEITPNKNIYSNASCTTNCLAPVAKILEDEWGIESGFMNTVHAYTSDQRLVDAPHTDLRRARAAAVSLIPTTTGATKAVEKVIPSLSGKLQGQSMRVPLVNGSMTDFVVKLKKKVSVEQVNELLRQASETSMKGILQYETNPIVSIDIVGNAHSGIVDSLSTQVIPSDPQHVRVGIWYDNEWGYSNRILDVSVRIAKTL